MDNFEKLVEDAIKKIPLSIRKKTENVAICVEKEPSNEQLKKLGVRYKNNLLGLYEGIPKKIWGRGFGNNLPDKITIFKNTIKEMTSNDEDLKNLIMEVIWHELAHHFGFNEKEVRLMEQKKKFEF